ncbi:uncharacterized protein EDB93DRAFT_1311691 [Suillus bovinus]|uniref:uncharacterized protein n=1 Tax=Suillus bovinus TaxID=48563 RepID=UPI001B873A41|nr:uncharacterized protein EDB93DRAFT_1311691 [Suillus bovinus]KAG2131285.1 hypothetical protein EDB93DRAFT_1311691 [Suillus bovinus]
MTEENPSRKKRWGLWKRSHSNPRLAEEGGQRAASDSSSLPPSSNGSRKGISRIFHKSFYKSARSARQSPNPEPTVASSSGIPPVETIQDPSPLVPSTLKPNPDQSSNSGIAKAQLPPDTTLVTETLAHAKTGVAGISPVRGIVQNTASTIGDLQSDSDTINQFSAILSTLKTFHAVVDQIANLHPYAKLALTILTQASKMILDQANLDSAVYDLLDKVSNVYVSVIEKKALANISSMIEIYTKIAEHTLKCAEFVVHHSETKSFGKRLGKHVFKDTDAEIRNYSDALEDLMKQFQYQAIGDAVIMLADSAEDRDLRDMEYAARAGLNTFKCCLEGTRKELLTEIKSWIGSTEKDVPRVLWLSGTAGKGKLAIAHTIAKWSKDFGGLGACFCFDRTRDADRLHEKIFTTIARDLADHNPIIRRALAHALHDHNELKYTADIASQWQELVVGPIQTAWNNQDIAPPVLIVIDALDENRDATSQEQILRLLAGKLRASSLQLTNLPANLRILITSRPLGDIRDILGSTPHLRHIPIDDIPTASHSPLYLRQASRST